MAESEIHSQFGNHSLSPRSHQTMTNSTLLLLPSYHGLDDSFHEDAIDFGIPPKNFCSSRFEAGSAWHCSNRETFSQLSDEYDLSMIEPTPIGHNVDVVKSFDIPQDPALQKLCMTLDHVADILSDSCVSKRPRDDLCQEYPASVKKQKMFCSMETPFRSESTRQWELAAPPAVPSALFQSSSDIPTMIDNASVSHKKTSHQEFRPYQNDHWATQYEAMIRFQKEHNHCFVPHQYPENPNLASWVKRQRYQYKVMKDGRHHTLTPERLSKLEAIGFVWDSHKAIWEERYAALCRYQEIHGHTNVPAKYSDKSLGIWVKCQRRQHRLFRQGKPSSMTLERIVQLERIGFDWKPSIGRRAASIKPGAAR